MVYDYDNVNDEFGELVFLGEELLSEGVYRDSDGICLLLLNGVGNYFVSYMFDVWLLWDWDGDGEVDNFLNVMFMYGVYWGNDNIIYKCE